LEVSDASNRNQRSGWKLRVEKEIVEFIFVRISNLTFDESENKNF
jgi:hypothetical protein